MGRLYKRTKGVRMRGIEVGARHYRKWEGKQGERKGENRGRGIIGKKNILVFA